MVGRTSVAVRMPPELIERLDALAVKLSKRAAGAEVSRSDVTRLAVERGIAVLEAELARARK